MRGIRAGCLGLALALAAPAVGQAGQPYLIQPIHINGTLCVVDGRLMVGLTGNLKHGYDEWTLPAGWRSKPAYLSPSDAGGLSSRFVGYDPRTGAVVLAHSDRGDIECGWRVGTQRGVLGDYLQAAGGKYEGWYMTVAEEVEKATDCDGNPYTFHRLLLTEKPSKRSEWAIAEIGK